jgi:hypothetical protein
MGIDVSVIDPRQVKYYRITRSIIAPGTAAKDREKDKLEKYTADYVSQNCQFEPFVMESSQAIHLYVCIYYEFIVIFL